MLYTSLKRLRDHPEFGDDALVRRLRTYLGKKRFDSQLLSLTTMVDVLGLGSAIQALNTLDNLENYDREIRLLAVQYARRVQDWLPVAGVGLIDGAERYANGQLSFDELQCMKMAAIQPAHYHKCAGDGSARSFAAEQAALSTAQSRAVTALHLTAVYAACTAEKHGDENQYQAALFRRWLEEADDKLAPSGYGDNHAAQMSVSRSVREWVRQGTPDPAWNW